ncbi:MAG TPA: c-type cytochrome [Myxococcota bacterium]|nr:c-type cytochrome [Myxococcota bacterium]
MTRANVLATTVLLLSSVALAPVAAEERVESGKQLYQKYCASCHGMNGRGDTPIGKLFTAPPPDLTRIATRRGGWFPEVLVKEIVDGRFAAHGGREMPVWGEILTTSQITLVTEYLFSIQNNPMSVSP